MDSPTRMDLEGAMASREAHYNKGDNKNYGHAWRLVRWPRLSFIDWINTEEKTSRREYYIDGALAESLDAALELLKLPPVYTEEERALLERIPAEATDYRTLECQLAGIDPKDASSTVMMDDPRWRISRLTDALKAKGAVEFGRAYLKADDGDDDPLGLGPSWLPTIRRING